MTILVLHVGLPGTGARSIQATLERNREALLARGILFPATLPGDHTELLLDAFADAPERHDARRCRGERDALREHGEATLAALEREFAATRPKTVVLSAEGASALNGEEIGRLRDAVAQRILPDAAVRVLLYACHPVRAVAGAVEAAVTRRGLSLDEAKGIEMDRAVDRYRLAIGRWCAVFGETAVSVRGAEAAAQTGGVVADLLASLGTERTGIAVVRREESVADEIVEFLAERNARGARPLAEADAARLCGLGGSAGRILSESEKRTVWRRALEDAIFLAERWGIEYEPPPPATVDVAAERERYEEIRAALASVLGGLEPALAEELADRFHLPLPPRPAGRRS